MVNAASRPPRRPRRRATRAAALGAIVCGAVVAAVAITPAQDPGKSTVFPGPDPATSVVIRPGAVISLGIPDDTPPLGGGRPGRPEPQNPSTGRPGTPESPPITDPNTGRPTQPETPGIPNPNTGRPTAPGAPDEPVTGAWPAPPDAPIPEGLSADGPLRITRWATWRRVTDHGRSQPPFTMYALRISADGRRIAFGGYEGVRTVGADGSGSAVVSTKRTEDGSLDINADGTTVAWYSGEEGLIVADADGSERRQLPVRAQCFSVRLSGDGRRVFVLEPGFEGGGIVVYPADGGPGRTLVTTEQAARTAGVDANGNHWRGGLSGLDVSADGSRLVFQFLWDALALDVNTGALRRLTQHAGNPPDPGLQRVRISRDGSRIAWVHEGPDADSRYIQFTDWDGGGPVRQTGHQIQGSDWVQFADDGARLGVGWGLRFFPADGSAGYDATDLGSRDPLHRPQKSSIDSTGRRAALVVEEPVAEGMPGSFQVYVADFAPRDLAGNPALTGIAIDNPVMRMDGSSTHLVTLSYSGTALSRAGIVLMRPGLTVPQQLRGGLWDGLGDPEERPYIGGGPRPLVSARLRLPNDTTLPPGPVTVRVWAKDAEGRMTVVDLEGAEVR